MALMNERGFSLIEVLVATTIVVVALAGLAQLFGIAIAANQRAKSRTAATILAQEKIEELTAIDGDVLPGADFIDATGRLLGSGTLPPPGTVYVRRWTVEPYPAVPAISILQVRVTLLHHRAGGETARIVSVKTSRMPWR